MLMPDDDVLSQLQQALYLAEDLKHERQVAIRFTWVPLASERVS